MNGINFQKIKSDLKEFAGKNQIIFIVLFGSYATNTFGKNSDIDIAILTSRGNNLKKLKNYQKILFDLEKIIIINNSVNAKIDITNLNEADSLLQYEVVSNGILLYGDETKYALFELSVMRNYIGIQDLRNLEKKLIVKRQKLIKEEIYV